MSGPPIPNKLGTKVTMRDQSWMDLAERAWGSEFRAPDHGIYMFANGRKYDSTDKDRTGIYGVDAPEVFVFDGTQYPDMRDGALQSIGVPLLGQVMPAGFFNEIAVEDGTTPLNPLAP